MFMGIILKLIVLYVRYIILLFYFINEMNNQNYFYAKQKQFLNFRFSF